MNSMIVIAVLALSIMHPGYCFPQIAGSDGNRGTEKVAAESRGETSDAMTVVGEERKSSEAQVV